MLKKGDKVFDKKELGSPFPPTKGTVTRVAKDGSWADIVWGIGWDSSRKRLPIARLLKSEKE